MIRIAIGCSANNEDLESMLVLEYSIRKHTKEEVEITWMRLSRDPKSPFYSDKGQGWITTEWATPFTGFRWAVPALGGFFGKMIYFDSDFIVLDDVKKLWDEAFTGERTVIAKRDPGIRYCCSLWDCTYGVPIEQLWGQPGVHTQLTRTYEKSGVVQTFSPGNDWNTLDLMLPATFENVHAIHYTDVATQLQLKHCIPRLKQEGGTHWYDGRPRPHPREDLQKLFDNLYSEAVAAGYNLNQYRTEPYGRYQLRGSK